MTPARFDLLYLLRSQDIRPNTTPRRERRRWNEPVLSWMEQREITLHLGLHRSTVSKMITRLVDMGWLAIGKCTRDPRTNVVQLTPDGFRAIVRAMKRIFQTRVVLRAYEDLFRSDGTGRHVLDTLWTIWWTLREIGLFFGDRSNLAYDFGAPDII